MRNGISAMAILTAFVLSGCTTPMELSKQITFWGAPATAAFADRKINLSADTKYVNITGGEIIEFVVGNKSFGWSFDGPGEYHFDLMLVAPPGMLNHTIMAYVSPDPFTNGAK